LRIVFLFILIKVLVFPGCDRTAFNNADRILARVYNEYLYYSDIQDLVPDGTSPSDSLIITQNYINNWVRNQIMLFHAESNLSDEQKDFSRQLRDYRNSLIIYKYESELINQNLDTIIEPEEIETFYNQNKSNFKLNENIVQIIYAKVNEESPGRNKIRQLVQSGKEEERDSLEFYAIRYADDYGISDREWITFDELVSKVPINVKQPEAFLTKNTYLQHYEKPDWYYLHILNYNLADSISPLAIEEKKIRSIIINKRKKQLINEMQQELYDKAFQENNFEFY
jgi:hypothetical protein